MKQTSLIKFIFAFSLCTTLIYAFIPAEFNVSRGWLLSVFVSCSYILIGIFILKAHNTLDAYNIDSLSLVLFILFGTIFRIDTSNNNIIGIIFKSFAWVVCGLILIKLARKEISLIYPHKAVLIWGGIGVALSLVLSLITAYDTINRLGPQFMYPDSSLYTSVSFIAKSLADDASNDAIPEEFIFRGLLVGYFMRLFNDQKKAYIGQGIIFWLFHFVTLFTSPIGFWIIVPMGTLVFSLLIWRSRSLVPSIIAHTLVNAFHSVFVVVIANAP